MSRSSDAANVLRLYCDFRGLFVAPKWDGWRYVCGGCGKELHGR